ncbi:hypothetical protein A3A36_02400 [Candidatus Kaiserbacteria bacterium RIFCSPLOWO2_01_FULL_52_12b]|uniref:Uncharacterized protein n=1 Tax=Candidatus Kaiserbacteria bacterium RIFCSPLOWO2_01_FULL_52_12b TaxID=1798509 RepID=A0A1F6EWF4_9BACT|nr:MAG: hypothetical protein A3A36_02400 [Candidatus Kaiserbacteria bacterium RIFCSPLOWO2_01_FULL_52_12b]
MQVEMELVLIRAYQLNLFFIAKDLIELLKPTLSDVERMYLMEHGPEIVHQNFLHDYYTEPGGCTEGKEARRTAVMLEKLAKERFDRANVPEERRKLLSELLITTGIESLHHFPPKKEKDVFYHMNQCSRDGRFRRFKEVADFLDAPSEIKSFLTLLNEQSDLLAQKPELKSA